MSAFITPAEGISRPSRATAAAWIAFAVVLLATRLPLVLFPRLIDDEQVYAVVARELLHGGRPYLDAVERKPPLLFAVYTATLGAAGPRNWPALHLVGILWTLATMAGLYFILRRRFDRETGAIAAALYALYMMWGDYRNLAFNGEVLMNLPIVLAVLLTFGPGRSRRRPELLLAGGLIAIALLLKQPAGIAIVPLGLYLLSARYRDARGLDLGDSLWQATELAFGFSIVLAVAGVILARMGILQETLYWSVFNHRDPVGPGTWHYWNSALPSTLLFGLEAAPLCLTAAASFWPRISSKTWGKCPAEHQALAILVAASFIGVSVNGQFLFHYYLQLLPPLCLLAAPVIRQVLMEGFRLHPALPGRRGLLGWLGLTLVLFTAVDAVGLWQHRADSFAGLWLRAHSNPAERVYVWGQGDRKTGIYLDADRRPASRFIAPFPLTGHVFGGYPAAWGTTYEDRRVMPGAWDTLRLDFAAHPPEFIVDAETTPPGSRYPVSRYPVLSELLSAHYRPVKGTPDGTIYQRIAPGGSSSGTGGTALGFRPVLRRRTLNKR